MGTDIYIFLEFLLPNGIWVADEYHQKTDNEMGLPATCRNYDVFAALAGVRGEGPKPKGLPIDVSSHVRAIDESGSANQDHSHCSIDVLESLDEVCCYKVDATHPLYDNPFKHNSPPYVSIGAYARKMLAKHGYKDARVIVWFDH